MSLGLRRRHVYLHRGTERSIPPLSNSGGARAVPASSAERARRSSPGSGAQGHLTDYTATVAAAYADFDLETVVIRINAIKKTNAKIKS